MNTPNLSAIDSGINFYTRKEQIRILHKKNIYDIIFCFMRRHIQHCIKSNFENYSSTNVNKYFESALNLLDLELILSLACGRLHAIFNQIEIIENIETYDWEGILNEQFKNNLKGRLYNFNNLF